MNYVLALIELLVFAVLFVLYTLAALFRPLAWSHLAKAATYDYLNGVNGGTVHKGLRPDAARYGYSEVKLDFAAIAADRVAKSQAALAATDVMRVLGVLAGTWVEMLIIEVITAEGAASTVDIGDGSDTDGFIDGADINATGYSTSIATAGYGISQTGGKFYTADDTIDLLLNNNTIDVAVIRIGMFTRDARKYR